MRPLIITLVLLLCSRLHAQDQEQSAPSKVSDGLVRLKAVKELHLRELEGGLPTFYSPGFEAQARYEQSLIGDEISFYERQSKTEEVPAVLACLSVEQWAKPAQGLPYGMPSVSDQAPFVIVMPAEWDKVVALPFPKREDVSATDLAEVLSGGQRWKDVRFQGGYGVATHEIGHAVIRSLGINPQVSWFTELLASYIGFAYLNEVHPEVMRGNELFWKYGLAAPHPHTDLEYFEHHGDEMAGNAPLNYVWYQTAFDVEGLSVYRAQGTRFVQKVQAAFPRGGPKLDTQQVLDKLESIQPGWKAWAKRIELGQIGSQDIQIEGRIR